MLFQQISNKMNKKITIALGLILVASGYFLSKQIIGSKKTPEQTNHKVIKTVFTKFVENIEIPIKIEAGGIIQASERIELFSEVQGVMLANSTPFKPGSEFRKGEILIQMDPTEYKAGLIAQKSNFFTSLTAIMADLKLDFPTNYIIWEKYLKAIDFEKNLPDLPKIENDKLTYFLAAKNIITGYHQVKNMEVRYDKYSIAAPYNGILTDGNLNPGTLIRPGQKLGEFIKPGFFEMEMSIPVSFSPYLKVNGNVGIYDKETDRHLNGRLTRINGKVEQNSQMLKIYITVNDPEMREGMYLTGTVEGRTETEVIEISRSLLIGDHSLFVVKNNKLILRKITPVFHNENTVVIRGLTSGEEILTKILPGAFNGMEVKTFNAKSSN